MFNYSRLCCFPTFLDIEACLSFLRARRKVSVYHGLNWIKLDVVTSERILYVNVHLLCEIYYARLVREWLDWSFNWWEKLEPERINSELTELKSKM